MSKKGREGRSERDIEKGREREGGRVGDEERGHEI